MRIKDIFSFGRNGSEPKKRGRPRPRPTSRVRMQRKYEAARINRLSEDVPIAENHINSDLRADGPILIARARWLARNEPYIRRGLKLIANNVIGAGGIHVNPMIPNRTNQNIDEELSRVVAKAWKEWGQKGCFDPTDRFSYRSIQRATMIGKTRDGESFQMIGRGTPTNKNPFGFWLQQIDPLRIPHDMFITLDNGNSVCLGVELTPEGTPVAYYIQVHETSPAAPDKINYHGRHYQRIPAERIIHDFDAEFPEQVRGASGMVGAMLTMPNLGAFIEAEVIAARQAASTMGWYKETEESFEDYTGDDDDYEDEDGDFVEDIEPGVMRKVPRGWDVEMHNPNHPNTAVAEFVKTILRGVASDLNVSYNSLANDLEGVNLSSIRHGTQEDREQYSQLQSDQIETNIQPVYEEWIVNALGLGLIRVGGNRLQLNQVNLDRLKRVQYRARGWEFPEPLKDAQANNQNIGNGLTSISEVIRKTGRDPDQVFNELASDIRKLEELGITPTAFQEPGAATASQGSPQPDEDD